MGCNAWNHPRNCNCGWGGDTGGGYGTGRPQACMPVQRQPANGFQWRFTHGLTLDSFVNPNATCPVCGASVYFYQSPSGGRVFFDELGPPWQKHPCTSRDSASAVMRQGLISKPAPSTLPLAAAGVAVRPVADKIWHPRPHAEWRPLLFDEMAEVADHDRLKMPFVERLPGRFIYVPRGWVGDAPSYWRWHPDDPRFIEISCIKLGMRDELETRVFSSPNWISSDEQFQRWLREPEAALDAQELTAIGYSLSFAWRVDKVDDWYVRFPGVNFALAKSYFEQAAAANYWPALNNLGVMYAKGLGVASDTALAFRYFERAAQSLELFPLRRLASCYRGEFGHNVDPKSEVFIEELIGLVESKMSDKPAPT